MFKKILLIPFIATFVFANDIDAEIMEDLDFFQNFNYVEDEFVDETSDFDDDELDELFGDDSLESES